MVPRFTLVCLLIGLFAAPISARVWTDKQGKKVEGTFVRVHEGKVIIRTNGKLLKVPFGALSQEDQRWVRDELTRKGQTEQLDSLDGSHAAEGTGEPSYPDGYGGDGRKDTEDYYNGAGGDGTAGSDYPEGYPGGDGGKETEDYFNGKGDLDTPDHPDGYPTDHTERNTEDYFFDTGREDGTEFSDDYPMGTAEQDTEAYFNGGGDDLTATSGGMYDASGDPEPSTVPATASASSSTAPPPTASATTAAPYALKCDTCDKEMPSGTNVGDPCPHCEAAAERSIVGLVIGLIVVAGVLMLGVVVIVAVVLTSRRTSQRAMPNYYQQSAYQR